MREIRGDVFQGRFHNLLISKNSTFWVPQILRITFQVVTVTRGGTGPDCCSKAVHAGIARSGSASAQAPRSGAAACAGAAPIMQTSNGRRVQRRGRVWERIGGPPGMPLAARATFRTQWNTGAQASSSPVGERLPDPVAPSVRRGVLPASQHTTLPTRRESLLARTS